MIYLKFKLLNIYIYPDLCTFHALDKMQSIFTLTSRRSQPEPVSASCSSSVTEGADLSSTAHPAAKQSGCSCAEAGIC